MSFLAPIALRILDSFKAVDRVVRNHDARIRELVGVPVVRGRLLEDVSVSSSGSTVAHGLGRTPKGAQVVKMSSETVRSFIVYNFTNKTLDLKVATGSQTVNVWVF